MNAAETALMNNPVRRAIQRRIEAPMLRRFGGTVTGEWVLEIGCGQGVGTEIILEQFGAAHVTALDLDPAMVDLARQRLGTYGDRVAVAVGDAEHVDAVFDFVIIHHITDWRAAVTEVRRVLRPGGRFFFEEVTTHALARWSYRTFLDHPTEDRFGAFGFVHELEQQGLHVGDRATTRFFGDFVVGVATLEGGD
jgi:ubiquinone/menaquinone biosynthesis C-methylase UbiE